MLRFCGFHIELEIDSILEWSGNEAVLFSASSPDGQLWLIVRRAADDIQDACFWCAPASRRALDLVASRQAQAADVVRHSLTGWVEIVRMVAGHAVPDRRISCSELVAGPGEFSLEAA